LDFLTRGASQPRMLIHGGHIPCKYVIMLGLVMFIVQAVFQS